MHPFWEAVAPLFLFSYVTAADNGQLCYKLATYSNVVTILTSDATMSLMLTHL